MVFTRCGVCGPPLARVAPVDLRGDEGLVAQQPLHDGGAGVVGVARFVELAVLDQPPAVNSFVRAPVCFIRYPPYKTDRAA
jgi:hypothetical protein